MACSLNTQVKNRLIENKLAKEVGNTLIVTAPESLLVQEAMKMAIDLAREEDIDGIPFTVVQGQVIVDEKIAFQVDTRREILSKKPLQDVVADSLEEEVLSSLRQVFRDFKIDENIVESLKDKDGNPLKGVAAADITNRSIQYLQGNADRPTEEYIHFYIAALSVMDSPLYKSMATRILGTEEYTEVLGSHEGMGYTEQDFIDEAITKRVLKTILEPGMMKEAEQQREARWWKRAVQWLKDKLNLSDPYKRASLEMLNKDLGAHREALNGWERNTIFRSAGNIQERVNDLIADTQKRVGIESFKKDYYAGKIDTKYLDLFEDEDSLVARYHIDGVPIERRATDRSSIAFMWSVGGIEEAKEIGSRKRSRILSSNGTKLHGTMEALIPLMVQEKEFKGKFNLILFEESPKKTLAQIKKESGIPESMFHHTTDTLKAILKDRAKGLGPKEKVNIYQEIKLYSKKEKTAGTVDLLFVDPDGYAHVYDYKFISPKNTESELVGGEYLLRLDPFRGPKGEGYEDQMMFYVRTVIEMYNVSGVKTSRLIPGHVRMAYAKGAGITDTIAYFNMDSTIDPELMQYPVANELPEGLMEKKVQEFHQRRDELKGRKKTEAVIRELNTIRTTLKELANVGSMVATRSELGSLIKYAQDGLKIKKKDSPEYLSMKDIVGLQNALSLYANTTAITGYKLKDIKDKKEKASFRIKMALISEKVDQVVNDLRLEGRKRLYEDLPTDFVDLDANSVPIRNDQWMTDVASVDNEYFKAAMYVYVAAQEDREERYRDLVRKWTPLNKKVEEWAAGKGMSTRQAMKKLATPTSMGMRLVNMFKEEFNAKRKEMYADAASGRDADVLKAVKWTRENYQIMEGAKERYKKAKERKSKKLIEEFITKTSYGYKTKMAQFEKSNDVFDKDNVDAWVHRSSLKYLEVKPEKAKDLYSKEYGELNQVGNEPLLAFYTAWKSQIADFNDLLDGRYINTNTIPSILIGSIEAGFEGKGAVSTFAKNMMHSITIEEENEEQIGEDTVKRVPLGHLKPILNDKGEFDESRISMDLGRAMLLFGDAIYKHVALDDAEARIQMIRSLLSIQREVRMKGGKFLYKGGRIDTKDLSEGTLSEFDTMMDVLLYGNISKLELGSFKMNGKTVSVAKLLMQMKVQYGKIKMTLPIKAAAGAATSAIAFRRAKAVDNPNYSQETLMKGMTLWHQDNAKYKAFSKFFDVHSKDFRFESEQSMRGDILSKYMDSVYLYYPLIPADEMGDRRLLIAMLYTHGISKEGKLARLEDLPEGEKSLIETATFKDDVMGGIPKAVRFEMKMRFMEEVKGVRGNMSPYMFALYESNVMFSIGMQFKGWMPEMLQDRFGKIKYNIWADRLMEGRYRTLIRQTVNSGKELDKDDVPVELQEMAWYEVMGSTAKGIKELVTMLVSVKGYTSSAKKIQKLKDDKNWSDKDQKKADKTKAIYEEQMKEMQRNTTSPKLKNMDLEAYMQFQEQNISSALAELRYVFSWLLLTGLMGMAAGDEDDKLLNKGHTKLMDLMGRINMELAMFINPLEALYLNKSGIPLFGMLEMFGHLVTNGSDEIRDKIMGENSPNDTTPPGYYLASFVYGTSNIRWLLK